MYILGVSAFYHDAAAALIKDGKIIAASQEERFTRIKHDAALPFHSIDYCLKEENLTPDKLDCVVFYDNSLLTLDRYYSSNYKYPFISLNFYHHLIWVESMREFYKLE